MYIVTLIRSNYNSHTKSMSLTSK